jgi:hypothetical protein
MKINANMTKIMVIAKSKIKANITGDGYRT